MKMDWIDPHQSISPLKRNCSKEHNCKFKPLETFVNYNFKLISYENKYDLHILSLKNWYILK